MNEKDVKEFTALEEYMINLIIDYNEDVFDEESLALILANDMKLFKEGKLYYNNRKITE